MKQLRSKIINRIQLEQKLLNFKFIKKSFDPESQLLIFSDPRSGSTWLAELINTINNTAIFWEPLNILQIKEIQNLNFGWRQFIPENESWPEAKHTFDQILSGSIRNEWTLLKTNIQEFRKAERLIIKFCRGNMLLPWLVNNYSFIFKPIYLVRHPFAVVNSQLKQGGWNTDFIKFKVPDIPYNEVYQKHYNFIYKLESKEELLTAIWCLTNKIALGASNKCKYKIIFYEDLVQSPINTLRQIFQEWNLKMPNEIFNRIDQKSSTSIRMGLNINKSEYLTGWNKTLSDNQKSKMIKIIDYFKMEDLLPKEYLG